MINAATDSGFDFYIGIPSTFLQPPRIVLVLDNPVATHTNYSVETAAEILANGVLNGGSVNAIVLNKSFQVYSSEYSDRNKGIRIRSTGKTPISVAVANLIPISQPIAFEWYNFHQNRDLNFKGSFEYFTLSTDYNGQSFAES